MHRRHILILLILSALILAVTPFKAHADDLIASGAWGTCEWTITEDGVLTVHPGIGAATEGSGPWADYADIITSIVFVEEEGKKAIAPADISGLFLHLSHVSSIDAVGLDVSGVTNMSSVFETDDEFPFGSSLREVDITGWDTSHVTSMNRLFLSNSSLVAIKGLWDLDVSSVEDMDFLFYGCSSLRIVDLSSWDVSSVRSMSSMFASCSSVVALGLSKWDVSSVTDMDRMFYRCSRLSSVDLSSWDVSSVKDMSYMFYYCSGLSSLDLSGWDTSKVGDMSWMFAGCSSLEYLDVPSWGWDTSSVVDMSYMFLCCESLVTLDLSCWDTSALSYAEAMFESCKSLVTLDLSSWSTGPYTTMSQMFWGCSALKTIYAGSGWTTEYKNSSYGQTFLDCTSLVGGNGTVYTDNLQTAHYCRIDAQGRKGLLTDASARPTAPKIGIEKAQISGAKDEVFAATCYEPEITVALDGVALTHGVDYMVAYANNVTPGTARVIVYGIGSYTGSAVATFEIARRSISSVIYNPPNETYDGLEHGRDMRFYVDEVMLVEGADYTVEYGDIVNVGTAEITIRGIGNYEGTAEITFDIEPISLYDAVVTLEYDRCVFDGGAAEPGVRVELDGKPLEEGIDFRVEYEDNLGASGYGAYAYAYGIGNYGDSAFAQFYIDPRPITETTIEPIPDQAYTFGAIEPELAITFAGNRLEKDIDYSVEYVRNDELGTATVLITGMDNFSGTTETTFEIVKPEKRIENADINIEYIDVTYTGSPCRPMVSVEFYGEALSEGVDYVVEYKNNVRPGKATVIITGIGEFSGKGSVDFLIAEDGGAFTPVGPFRDVYASTPHCEDVLWLADSGISTGWAEKDGTRTFRPTSTVVRQDMAAFLFRLAKSWGLVDESWQPTGSVTFTDVNESTPHYREIMWLAESGISAGWKKGDAREFRPRNTVVRQDMAAFLRRLQALRDPSVKTWKPTGGSPFRDVTASTPHYEDIVWLAQSGVSAGWTVGGAKEFRPMNTVIRQDMAAFLHRLDGVPVGVELSAATEAEAEQEQPEALSEDLADVSAVDELVDEMQTEDVSGDIEEAEGVDIAEVEVEPTAEAEPGSEQDLEYETDAEAGAELIEDDEPTVDAAA